MKYFILFIASFFPLALHAQNTFDVTPLHQDKQLANYYHQMLQEKVIEQLGKINWDRVDKRSTGSSILYTIPVVVHVLHDYGLELVADSIIYNAIEAINSVFTKTNADTISIIPKFIPVAASTQISFKLANLDPNGNPTKGVEHIHTYLTHNAFDQSKINQWPQVRYLNIWLVSDLIGYSGFAPATYVLMPHDAASVPYYDGIIYNCSFWGFSNEFRNGQSLEFAKYLGLPAICGFGPGCTDGDLIPDTPPCKPGSSYTCSELFDTTCDTPNVQNIMSKAFSYGDCQNMFTYGQGLYMQNMLHSVLADRDSLVTPNNYTSSGMDKPQFDLPVIPDFSTIGGGFFYPNTNVAFRNHSWNDTILHADWTFSNIALKPADTSMFGLTNQFYQPGWVTVSMAVTGNNTGITHLTDSTKLFIADIVATSGINYYQEFAPGGDLGKWPMFNYYTTVLNGS